MVSLSAANWSFQAELSS
ncbi:hypothetical protein YPPY46_2744, partial [Yersinia pestis PY-46]